MSERSVYAISGFDACTVYRIAEPFDALNTLGGWRCEFGPAVSRVLDYDVVVGPRLGDGPCPEFEMACRDEGTLAVYDMDDDLTGLDPENTIPYQRYAPWVANIRRLVSMADIVTVCTPYAAERMSELNSNVVILPICANREWLREPRLPRFGRPLTLGWAGAPFHHQDWEELLPRLRAIAERHPDVWFQAMGADYSSGIFAGRQRPTVPWQPHRQYLADIDFDIGLCPLRRSPSNRGKSWTKPLEFGCAGVPFVGTKWGQYPDWQPPYSPLGGLLVEDDDDWITFVEAMLDDSTRWTMARSNAALAAAWTIDQHIDDWARTYSGG